MGRIGIGVVLIVSLVVVPLRTAAQPAGKNGQDPTGSSAPDSPKEIATVELPPRDDVISPNGDQGDDDCDLWFR